MIWAGLLTAICPVGVMGSGPRGLKDPLLRGERVVQEEDLSMAMGIGSRGSVSIFDQCRYPRSDFAALGSEGRYSGGGTCT